jgi:hypothetical protein
MAGAFVVALLLGLGWLAYRGLLVWLVLGVLLCILARKRTPDANVFPERALRLESLKLRLQLLRARVAALDDSALDDVALAERDFRKGKITLEEMQTALERDIRAPEKNLWRDIGKPIRR